MLACPDVKFDLDLYFRSFSRLLTQMMGLLYVGSYDRPFAQMKVRETLVHISDISFCLIQLLKIVLSLSSALYMMCF